MRIIRVQAENGLANTKLKEVEKLMKRLGIVAGILLAALLAFGGITVGAQQANQNGSIRIKSDEAGFADMAKISIDSAVSAALTKVPGKAVRAELQNENGFLVYGVEIAKADHQFVDVKVDAGNGKVLKIDQDPPDKGGRENESGGDSDRGHEEKDR
jgi:uncharacterized membrane protein YkoI